MTRTGLIEALQRKAAEDAEALWRDARADADRLRRDATHAIEEQRRACAAQTAATARRIEGAAEAQAERAARDGRTLAASALAERLYRLALAELPRLQAQHQQVLFGALAAELPSLAWQRLRVNPADVPTARRLCPGAEVEGDAAIAGGVDGEAERGRIRVNNTLEARLEVAWPDLAPGLVARILAQAPDHAAAA